MVFFPTTEVLSVLCHEIAPLSSCTNVAVFHSSRNNLWSIILHEKHHGRNKKHAVASHTRASNSRVSKIYEVKNVHESMNTLKIFLKSGIWSKLNDFSDLCRKHRNDLMQNKNVCQRF